MTWANNYRDRNSTSGTETGKRAKPIKHCAMPGCNAGIPTRGGKLYCSPCNHERKLADRTRRRAEKAAEKAAKEKKPKPIKLCACGRYVRGQKVCHRCRVKKPKPVEPPKELVLIEGEWRYV